MKRSRWSPWALAGWATWGIAFVLLECLGLSKAADRWPPLTYVFRRYVPQVLGIGVTSWLAYHAAVTYATAESE